MAYAVWDPVEVAVVANATDHAVDLVDLDARLLLTFTAVCEHGTFGAAARALGYTQSAVSQQVARLEHLVGGALFIRPGGPRPVELTSLGDLLGHHAEAVLDRIAATARAVSRHHAGDGGHVDLGTFQSMSATVVPAILHELRSHHPDIDLRLEQRLGHAELLDLLRARVVDLTFSDADALDDDGHESLELFRDPYVVIAHPGLLPSGRLRPADLDGHTAVGFDLDACQVQADRRLAARGAVLDFTFRTTDNTTIAALVRASDDVAVLPRLAVMGLEDGLSIHPLDPPIEARRIHLLWRSDDDLTPAARQVLEIAVRVTAPLREDAAWIDPPATLIPA